MPELAFFDFETRSLCDLTVTGEMPYARHPSTDVLVCGYIFDDEPLGNVWSPWWAWGNVPPTKQDDPEPTALLDHVENGGYVVAWHAIFDRLIWNHVLVPKYDWPKLKIEQVLCAQAQAEANNLPGKLEKAAEALGTNHKKDPQGKRLIQLLSIGDRDTWNSEINETPERMGHFRAYCNSDNETMRDIWQATRPLTLPEWEEYWASEHINDHGVAVDVQFARAAQLYALAESKDINGQMAEVTNDNLITITNHVRKARWLHDELWPHEEIQALTKRPPKDDKERFSCDRPTREAVLDLLTLPENAELFEPDHLDRVINFLELVEAGNSAAVAKFGAIANRAYNGRVYGMYACNGAGQTGRYSSRGVQTHNLIRDPLEKGNPDRALDAIDDIMAGVAAQKLSETYKYPISRLLARLLRPTFIAPEGKLLLWGDWGQIEGRGLPWLSKSPGGDMKLDLYRQGVDVYSVTASGITGMPVDQIDDFHRQAMGKVPELALGFGGSVGAFSAMGRNYGVVLPAHQVKEIVTGWRQDNDWCVQFWYKLWDAFMSAYTNPGTWVPVGRVRYFFHPTLMRGTVICELPCGRWLVYPQFKHERVIVKTKDAAGNEREEIKWRSSFVKGFAGGFGRVDIWYGTLAENITQGMAASVLRNAIVELQDHVVLHTHDELVLEIPDSLQAIEDYTGLLREVMEDPPDWADGLPLVADIEYGPFYTK